MLPSHPAAAETQPCLLSTNTSSCMWASKDHKKEGHPPHWRNKNISVITDINGVHKKQTKVTCQCPVSECEAMTQMQAELLQASTLPALSLHPITSSFWPILCWIKLTVISSLLYPHLISSLPSSLPVVTSPVLTKSQNGNIPPVNTWVTACALASEPRPGQQPLHCQREHSTFPGFIWLNKIELGCLEYAVCFDLVEFAFCLQKLNWFHYLQRWNK